MIQNAYYMHQSVRENLNEAEESHWDDWEILKKLTAAQKKAWMMLTMAMDDWMLTSTTLTPSSSLVTLPSDCAKPVYMEDAVTGAEIPFSISVRNRRVTRVPGTTLETINADAYMLKDYIEINQASYSNNVKLWYVIRPTDLLIGQPQTGSTTAIIVCEAKYHPSTITDYYKDSLIEVVDGNNLTMIYNIADYAPTTQKITTETYTGGASANPQTNWNTSYNYGTISKLPEEAQEFIVLDATMKCLAKPSSTLSEVVFTYMKDQWKEAMEMFEDYISTRIHAAFRTETTEIE